MTDTQSLGASASPTGLSAPALRASASIPGAERCRAEAAYILSAFDYPADPVGSRDWVMFYRGWQERSQDRESCIDQLRDALQTLLHAFPGDYTAPPWHIVKARDALAAAATDAARFDAAIKTASKVEQS